jgi:hypothetical protein
LRAKVATGRTKVGALGLSDDQQQRIRQSALAPGEVKPVILAQRREIVARLNYDTASIAALSRSGQLAPAPTNGHWEVEIQAIRLAPGLALIGVPCELMVELGDRIRDRSGLASCLVVGYANDSIGYVVTPQAIEEGGYEAGMTMFAPSAGPQLADAAAALAREIGG